MEQSIYKKEEIAKIFALKTLAEENKNFFNDLLIKFFEFKKVSEAFKEDKAVLMIYKAHIDNVNINSYLHEQIIQSHLKEVYELYIKLSLKLLDNVQIDENYDPCLKSFLSSKNIERNSEPKKKMVIPNLNLDFPPDEIPVIPVPKEGEKVVRKGSFSDIGKGIANLINGHQS